MAFITVSNSFTNSTTADASQVNTNFSDIINGTSDGTKDFSISALTVAGVFTANGNVILGNASSDDVTITGSLAATFPIKTNTSFDLGTSTKGLSALFIGGTSTFTSKLVSATLTASRVNTIPEIGGDVTFEVSQAIQSITTGTTTLTTANKTILCDTSGGVITLNLPAVSGRTGQYLVIKKTTNDLTVITIDGNASETIDGATTKKISTYNEMVRLLCNGTSWFVVGRKNDTPWVAFTPTGSWTTNVTYAGFWRRVGDTVQVRGQITFAGDSDATALTLNLPTGMTMDTAKLSSGLVTQNILGVITYFDDSDVTFSGDIRYSTSTVVGARWISNNDGAIKGTFQSTATGASTSPIAAYASGDFIQYNISSPIANWED